ncbi:sensor histidine kinase [Flavisolibacter tropicus]|uniref:sensor histidine kinase n=1 Tax=Flavisolibacter tropicus TaxID=1492898 RepID=UPI000836807A|nr:histidine kinase [Flavisolibacter tropicus]
MNTSKRFRFWRVFWVVLGLYLFFGILGIITMSITPEAKEVNLAKMLTWRHLSSQVASLLFTSLFYYFSLNAFYPLYATRKPAIHFLKPAVLTVLAVTAYYSFTYYFLDRQTIGITVNNGPSKVQATMALLLFAYFIGAAFYLGATLLIAYLTYLRDERLQRKVLEEQKLQLEVEKSQANFNFLKAQINPHFLHNTLNFLYAKSLPYSPELSEGILTLSEIMRYALSEGNTKDGKTALKDEIEHLRNVIKINQLRFSNKLNVQLDLEGVINGARIIPFVLITLVENAFKHGDLKSTEYPITIRVVVMGHKLFFYCRNKKKSGPGPKELSTGIGLDNIKKRLELAYGDNYEFKVRDEAEFYTTELTIDPL